MTSFKNLEERCRRITEDNSTGAGPTKFIASEIALTLEQIDAVRNQNDELNRRHTDLEMDLKTRILSLRATPLEYSWDRWAIRKRMTHQLDNSLVRLEQQVQRLALDREKTLHSLQDRLLELWNKREQLQ